MNEPSDQPRDRSLSRLYQESARSEPPPHLDQAILAAARTALRPTPARPASWWLRLRAPLALAATVMLTVMLALTVDRNPPQVDEPAAPLQPRQAAPEPPVSETTSDSVARQAPAPSRERKKTTPDAPAVKTEAKPAPLPALRDEAPTAAPSASAPASATSGLGAAAGLAAPPSAAPPLSAENRMNSAARAERADRAAKQDSAAAPATWLDEIRELRRQGRLAEAERRLQEFRRAFPDYPLPDDLR